MITKLVTVPHGGSEPIKCAIPHPSPKKLPAAVSNGPLFELIDIKKAAKFLGVSVSTVRRMQQARTLSVYRVAGRVMFDLLDLIGYLKRRRIWSVG